MHSLEYPSSTDRSSQVAPDGTVETGNLRVPFSVFASAEARQTFLSGLNPAPPEIANDLAALRAHYAAFNDRLRDLMLERFKVEIVQSEIGGIPVHRVTPISPRDATAAAPRGAPTRSSATSPPTGLSSRPAT